MVENHGVQGYVVGPGDGVSGHGPGVLATRVSTVGALTLIEQEIRDGPPWHVHTREEECFYVLDGSLTVHCGDDIFEAGPRSFVFLPRGIPHRFDAVDGPATVLLIAAPGGLDEYFDELHQPADPTSRAAVQQKYGIQRR